MNNRFCALLFTDTFKTIKKRVGSIVEQAPTLKMLQMLF
jgi:hypothetical protein